jgi:uncharacterized protein YciU (UPF0263 family)
MEKCLADEFLEMGDDWQNAVEELLAPSYVAETIRKFASDFGTADDSNIVSIRG